MGAMRIGQRSLVFMLLAVTLGAPLATGAQGAFVPPWREPLRERPPEATITVGEEALRVQVVRDTPDVTLGLGYRNGLEPGTGMLFVFGEESTQSFWMKGMRFCLDIVWITNDQIVGAAERVCPDRVEYLAGSRRLSPLERAFEAVLADCEGHISACSLQNPS